MSCLFQAFLKSPYAVTCRTHFAYSRIKEFLLSLVDDENKGTLRAGGTLRNKGLLILHRQTC